MSLTVTPVNDRLQAQGAAVTTLEDTPAAIVLAGLDPDGDPLSYEILQAPTRGRLTGSGANLVYAPDANWSGSDSLGSGRRRPGQSRTRRPWR